MIDVPILVKDALKDGRRKKNYRILVLNDDGTTDFVIDNNTLVSEQADIDERMCSGDTIKFGLCEGSSFQFQYFDHPNITDRQIQVFIDAQYIGTEYENVQKFQRYSFITLEEGGNYRAYSANANGFSKLYLLRNGSTQQLTPTSTDTETYVEFGGMVGDQLEVEWTEFPLYDTYLQKQTPDMLLEYPIPMGFFTVKNCSRQASTGIIKATAYNKLMSEYLDQKANDLIDAAYASLETDSYISNVTVDLILREVLGDYAIDNTKPVSKWSIMFNKSPFTVNAYTSEYTAYQYYAFNIGQGVCIQVQDSSILSYGLYPWSIVGYTRVKIKGIDALKQKLKDTFGSSNYEQNVSDSIFFLKIYLTSGVTYSLGLKSYLQDEIYTPILDAVDAFDVIMQDSTHQMCHVNLCIPGKLYALASQPQQTTPSTDMLEDAQTTAFAIVQELMSSGALTFEIIHQVTGGLGEEVVDSSVDTWADVTLRELQTAVFESQCQFGQISRVTDLFAGVELNKSRLLPQIDLYPDTALYPSGAQTSSFKSMYSNLWADEGNVQKWRNLIITYKGLDENNQEKEFTLQRQINADGTQDYNMSDNWLFKNLTWTSQKVGDYADAMVAKMRDITWFPFEMWCAGIPYLETGDEIEITVNQSTYTSYVLQRQLKGIQNLQDTFLNGTLDIF